MTTDETRAYFAEFAPRVGSKKPVSIANAGAAPTTAQVKYLYDLCDKTGQERPDAHRMTRSEVADSIDALKGRKRVEKKPSPPPAEPAPVAPFNGRRAHNAMKAQSPADHHNHNEKDKLF